MEQGYPTEFVRAGPAKDVDQKAVRAAVAMKSSPPYSAPTSNPKLYSLILSSKFETNITKLMRKISQNI